MKWTTGLTMALALTVPTFPESAFTQGTPRAEVSAGYSYLGLGGSRGLNQHGGNLSVAGNASRWFGIVGDFGFYHASPFGARLNTTTFMGGPRLSMRLKQVTPFGQVLIGGAHVTAGFGRISAGTTAFAISAGGGVDIRLSKLLALRPQAD